MCCKGLERQKTASNVCKNKNIEEGQGKTCTDYWYKDELKKIDVHKEAEKWKQINVEFREKFAQVQK
jgi:hypothetical protein